MGFLKRMIGNEPIESTLLGKYNKKNIMQKVEDYDTKIYLHKYSTDAIRIEIISIEKERLYSFFGQLGSRKTEQALYDLKSYPKIDKDKQVYNLVHFKSKVYGIVLIVHNKSASLILSPNKIIGFFNE